MRGSLRSDKLRRFALQHLILESLLSPFNREAGRRIQAPQREPSRAGANSGRTRSAALDMPSRRATCLYLAIPPPRDTNPVDR